MKKFSEKYKIAIITVSDKVSKGERKDESGEYIENFFKKLGCEIIYKKIIPDEKNNIVDELKYLSDELNVDLLLTTGGTGVTERDITPEATKLIIEREAPGISELIRMQGYKKTKYAVLSRGVSGIRKKTLIINLPGSLKGVKESLQIITPVLEHALALLKGKHLH